MIEQTINYGQLYLQPVLFGQRDSSAFSGMLVSVRSSVQKNFQGARRLVADLSLFLDHWILGKLANLNRPKRWPPSSIYNTIIVQIKRE